MRSLSVLRDHRRRCETRLTRLDRSPGGSLKINSHEAVDQLIEMGYLKYADDSLHDSLRSQLIETLKHGYLETDLLEVRGCTSDMRTYPADNEDLAEQSMSYYIENLREVFAVEGVVLQGDVIDAYDERLERYDVVVNGKSWRIFDLTGTPGVDSWGLAFKRYMEIVNSLFAEAGSPQRVYGIYGGNEAEVIVLTDEMYAFLRSPEIKISPRWMPFPSTSIDEKGVRHA